ncbi:M20/M25/M40 family metallo-hydrolase [Tengunoibacter tsumagoiensis]|uniref:Peptidase M20 n=1 Tax=Tengunoibacter tsumagoiensis TaxID=2014871 RepID=A0A402A388_9CHLR|nr:M20/M25/M40 family metallo-hydrolase [Tengunoibacter tsumagoiensis]GCE13617.1 peptidase M20 [Tengunoibacter tsumagoiensis]
MSAVDLERLKTLAKERIEDAVELAQRICLVPAPTGDEAARAEFVASLWRERGYTPEIDAIHNVYVRRKRRDQAKKGKTVMLLAHIDTVFPATTPLQIKRVGDILSGPGIGDNSLSVASLLILFDMLDELHVETETDLLAVADVGEEGLGNLRGARAAVERYHDQLGAVLVVDGDLGSIVNEAVGSQRWRIIVRGDGGHSFGSFGTPSAIHGLGRIIAALSTMSVPIMPKTTFNVGVIEGGTSVNTIAAQASALLDLRSTNAQSLQRLAEQAREHILNSAGPGLKVEIELLGERPAGQRSRQDALVQLAAQTLHWIDLEPGYSASSTDANIPMSLNLPTVCIGITRGEKAHTIDEFIHIAPIGKGLAQLLRLSIESSAFVSQ